MGSCLLVFSPTADDCDLSPDGYARTTNWNIRTRDSLDRGANRVNSIPICWPSSDEPSTRIQQHDIGGTDIDLLRPLLRRQVVCTSDRERRTKQESNCSSLVANWSDLRWSVGS